MLVSVLTRLKPLRHAPTVTRKRNGLHNPFKSIALCPMFIPVKVITCVTHICRVTDFILNKVFVESFRKYQKRSSAWE
jgi:hypothetical protein